MTIKEAFELLERVQRDYREQEAEARACGYEPASFEEYIGSYNAKAAAQERWKQRERADELDLY